VEKISNNGQNRVITRDYSEFLEDQEYILRELFKNQEYDHVEDTCIEYLTSYYKNYVAWYFLGLIYKKRGEPRKAKKAIKLNQKYGKLWEKENEAQW
jgi:hypothetical protein